MPTASFRTLGRLHLDVHAAVAVAAVVVVFVVVPSRTAIVSVAGISCSGQWLQRMTSALVCVVVPWFSLLHFAKW